MSEKKVTGLNIVPMKNRSEEDKKDFNDIIYHLTWEDGSKEAIKAAGFELFPGIPMFFVTETEDGEEYLLRSGFNISHLKRIDVEEAEDAS